MKNSCVKVLLAACVAIALLGCERAGTSENGADHYETRGIVRGFSPDRQTIEIQHEDIPGFMPSMTMPFVARDRKEIANLKTGDAISFRLTVTKSDSWIDHISKIGIGDVNLPEARTAPPRSLSGASPGYARLKEGDQVPPFDLRNQDGERITLENFRGRPFVLTFIFTRCPLPNFCPLMSSNFEQLQAAIKAASGELARTRLLSITLDPAYDTPKVLSDYAAFHHADLQIWTFATAEEKSIDVLSRAFSVYRQPEGGTISHGLATALVNKDGTIVKIWRGNAWNPGEVIQVIGRDGN